jgi:hypothetical protein
MLVSGHVGSYHYIQPIEIIFFRWLGAAVHDIQPIGLLLSDDVVQLS